MTKKSDPLAGAAGSMENGSAVGRPDSLLLFAEVKMLRSLTSVVLACALLSGGAAAPGLQAAGKPDSGKKVGKKGKKGGKKGKKGKKGGKKGKKGGKKGKGGNKGLGGKKKAA